MRRLTLAALVVVSMLVITGAQQPPSATEWRYYGGDASSTKYSPLTQINRANVRDLQVAWRWSAPDNEIVKTNPSARPGAFQDTPLMVNGVLYTTTSLGIYAALDPTTGRTLWQYDPETWKSGRPPNLGFTHRGAA
jgi:quinoprotein glucose dehydrogenase